jgi:F-type H+-transporting ATPase subunit b
MGEFDIMALVQDPTFWFAIAFVIFFAIVWPLAAKPVAGIFDAYAEKIRHDLAEAERLNKEAAALLASAKQRQHDARHEAEELLKQASEQAAAMRGQAEKELEITLKRREAQAMENIRLLEAKIVADIRQHAASKALKAAEILLQDNFPANADQTLVDKQIKQIAKA